ncbi:MAG: GWxTD domain-containing protein [Elusimicrobia bacterium]|nr:GWxTD domain-containing protein [Elusimicrobiota bacterium]
MVKLFLIFLYCAALGASAWAGIPLIHKKEKTAPFDPLWQNSPSRLPKRKIPSFTKQILVEPQDGGLGSLRFVLDIPYSNLNFRKGDSGYQAEYVVEVEVTKLKEEPKPSSNKDKKEKKKKEKEEEVWEKPWVMADRWTEQVAIPDFYASFTRGLVSRTVRRFKKDIPAGRYLVSLEAYDMAYEHAPGFRAVSRSFVVVPDFNVKAGVSSLLVLNHHDESTRRIDPNLSGNLSQSRQGSQDLGYWFKMRNPRGGLVQVESCLVRYHKDCEEVVRRQTDFYVTQAGKVTEHVQRFSGVMGAPAWGGTDPGRYRLEVSVKPYIADSVPSIPLARYISGQGADSKMDLVISPQMVWEDMVPPPVDSLRDESVSPAGGGMLTNEAAGQLEHLRKYANHFGAQGLVEIDVAGEIKDDYEQVFGWGKNEHKISGVMYWPRTDTYHEKKLDRQKEELKAFFEKWHRKAPYFLKTYFERVAAANASFSDGEIPGWRTDRGKVWIVLGPPDEVQRNPVGPDSAFAKPFTHRRFLYIIPLPAHQIPLHEVWVYNRHPVTQKRELIGFFDHENLGAEEKKKKGTFILMSGEKYPWPLPLNRSQGYWEGEGHPIYD